MRSYCPAHARRPCPPLLALTACLLALGCSSSSSKSAAVAGDGGDAGGPTATFEMSQVVKPGQEIFKCQLVALPSTLSAQAYMVSGSHQYTPGSHHLILYTTDYTSIPPGGDQVSDCSSSTSGDPMSHVHGLMYEAQTPQGALGFPPGVGMPATASQVLLFNVHYINTGTSDLSAHVTVHLSMTNDGASITQKAGVLFWYDPFIHVPAAGKAQAQLRCVVPNDITLVGAASHYHKRGVAYSAFLDPAPDQFSTTPFYTSSNWEDPNALTTPFPVKGGSAIRFQCSYDNTSGTTDFFQGQSALTNEMCMFVSLYYPEQGQDVDFCTKHPDMFGTGSASCFDTLTCLQNCPPSPTPMGLNAGYSPCQQDCFVKSCPAAGAKLIPLLQCGQAKCKAECGGSSDDAGTTSDAGSGSCASCLTTSCGTELTACSQQACN